MWSSPDPLLSEAGASGELLVARIRLALAGMLLLVPVVSFFLSPHWEDLVGLTVAVIAFLLSVGVYVLVAKDDSRSWIGFVTSGFDVTFVSGTLIVFLLLDTPHTAVNSKVVFEVYFLSMAATTLRYDVRICALAGLLTLSQYAAVVIVANTYWDLNSDIYAPFTYGKFDLDAQVSRLILLLAASLLSMAVVSRARRLRRLSTSDRLTGIFNRGYFDERFGIELSRARRYKQPLTIAMIDVDHFKLFNDTYGHAAGDAALQKIAAVLQSSFRQSDIVARYGGEEFVVVMPETDPGLAFEKVDKIRHIIADTPIHIPKLGVAAHLTISAGVASFPDDSLEEDDLLGVADERLFHAKNAGRNQVRGSGKQSVLQATGDEMVNA
ncbi:MAG TPA: GGDEF domain-containing protein [Pyrinomonadaceae bacterium]|nr:GGDEF domain-containing protein [Pyrinomonadaceae bacterium]